MAAPRISVGRSNYRASDVGSAAELGKALKPQLDSLAKDIGWYIDQLADALPEDLRAALEPTFELTQERVPVKTGELKSSGYLETEAFRNSVRVEMGYGKGGNPDYAVAVHELPYAHAEPTSNKYVQNPVDEDYYNIIQRVTDRLKERSGLG